MRARVSRLSLQPEPPPFLAGLIVAVLAVVAVTAALFPLRQISPATANGVLYLLPVLLVSTVWGLWFGLGTSVLSAAAFNFFHLPPTGRFTIADSRNWVALVAFLVAAVVAARWPSWPAPRAPRGRAAPARGRPGRRAGAPAARRGRASRPRSGTPRDRLAAALGAAARRTIVLRRAGRGIRAGRSGHARRAARPPDRARHRLEQRVVPALEALLAAALERDRLQAEVVETARPAPQRRAEDRAAALGLPRPAHARSPRSSPPAWPWPTAASSEPTARELGGVVIARGASG